MNEDVRVVKNYRAFASSRSNTKSSEASTEFPQALQQFLAGRLACHLEFQRIDRPDLDIVAYLQPQRLYHCRRQADSETVAPFQNPHCPLPIDNS
ncbi:hypothetical protein LCM4573_03260 [Rhizobium sp. LCM 4573]|nr:hypothetical protein LCM4573_03260 [Rhizobium sp. LCM 4573]